MPVRVETRHNGALATGIAAVNSSKVGALSCLEICNKRRRLRDNRKRPAVCSMIDRL
jgi:hypothetical protein